ncbi:MAG: hypothetical protein WCP69_09095 [Bacteroidota bacterium]
MGYGGHVLDMINRIKQNRELLETRKNKLKKFKSIFFKPISHQIIDRKQRFFTEEEKVRAIEKIDNDFKKLRRRVAIIETPIFIILIGIFIWLMWLMFRY